MKFTNLFNGKYYHLLSEKGKKEVDKEHIEWVKEMFLFLFFGFVLGFILGVLL